MSNLKNFLAACGGVWETLHSTKLCPVANAHEWDQVGARIEIAIDLELYWRMAGRSACWALYLSGTLLGSAI